MLLLSIDCTDRFLEAISLLTRLGPSANMHYSPAMLSLTIYHHSMELVIFLHMMPEFFARFFSNRRIQNYQLFLQPFFHTLMTMKQSHYSKVALFVHLRLNRVVLRFENPWDHRKFFIRKFELEYMAGLKIVGKIDLGKFVSIDSEDFRHVVNEFNGYTVHVTLTNSCVTFSCGYRDIVISKEERKCVIGPIEGQVQLVINIYPLYFFKNVAFQSKRAWLFKATDFCTMVIFPIGLFAEFMVYVPIMSI